MTPSRRQFLLSAAATGTALTVTAAGPAGAGSPEPRGILDRMDLDQKVAQLFVLRVHGHSATAPGPEAARANRALYGVASAAELLARYPVGGIIYFPAARNIRDPLQVAALSAGIQRAAAAGPAPVGVLISTDQEHGAVARIGAPATLLPGAMALGAGGSPGDAREAARIAGAELAALGVRHNHAPVADVNTNPANPVIGVRSFGSDPHAVAALDPSGDPATLSRAIVTGLLRERLGHRGVIITDSLGMAGVRKKYSDEEIPVRALLAGCDQLLNPPRPARAHRAVVEAVRAGRLEEERLDRSVLRVLGLKRRLGLLDGPGTDPPAVGAAVGGPAHLAAAERIAERTTTVLTDRAGLLPLSPARHPRVLVTGADPASPTGTTAPPTTLLARALTELGFTTATAPTGPNPTAADIDRAGTAARNRDAVLVCTYKITAGSTQRALVERLTATGVPVITLALRTPYDLAHLTGVTASLACYSWTPAELRAAARVLTGARPARGRLPVPLPPLFPLGHGLRPGAGP